MFKYFCQLFRQFCCQVTIKTTSQLLFCSLTEGPIWKWIEGLEMDCSWIILIIWPDPGTLGRGGKGGRGGWEAVTAVSRAPPGRCQVRPVQVKQGVREDCEDGGKCGDHSTWEGGACGEDTTSHLRRGANQTYLLWSQPHWYHGGVLLKPHIQKARALRVQTPRILGIFRQIFRLRMRNPLSLHCI